MVHSDEPRGERVRQQAEYWRATLADAPEPLELPADRPRPAQPDSAGARVRLELDEALVAALQALGTRHGATLSTTLLAGWAATLGRLSGQTDLVIGTSTDSRAEDGPAGRFEHPLPLRVDLSGSPTAAELLGRVQERGVALVQPDGAAASAAPRFRAAFAWRDVPASAPEPRATGGLDLSVELWEQGGRIVGHVGFATALFDRATVERYAGYLRRLLAGMAADETRPVDRLALLSDAERRRVTEEWNRTEAPYPADWYIHEQFQAQAARTPDRVAVVHEDRQLTYGELNRRANRLAHHLRSLGVGPDVRVGICVEREPELVVAIFGVLKAGGAYLPLDPGYPRERLLDMVRDSAPVVMLTQAALAGRLAGLDVPLVALDADAAWWQGQPSTNPERAALTPENLTYVIYTSGSTGRPKGVEMTHRGASNLLHWYLGATGISDRDAVLVVTSFSFHLTQRNLMAPLFVGGQVHLAREPFEPRRIAAQIVASGITMMNLTPTGFQALVEADGGRAIGGLRIVVFGGEPLYPRQLARVPEPRPVFLNPYGSTEATGITAHHFARADLGSYSSRSMPPGRPIANASIYVLDAAGEPVPVGVTGELYLGGAGVTRGYRGLPGHTAERYLPDPFGPAPGARMYRTGDLGRWLPDGTVEFMGRGDAQVKVRGFRIELGEIEARLAEHAAVHETVVVARDGEAGDPRLVAYHTGDPAGAAALRAHLAERLPEYMVPAAFVHMDALPVNPNGKLDRKALPAPDFASEDETYVAPRTPVEEVLAGIWAEVLGLERMGVEDSFFERGGHSLLATRAVSRVRELLGVELPLRALFEGPTVAELAVRVEQMRRAELPAVVPVERTGPLPLSFAQERLWFLERLEPGSATYHLPVAWRLEGALDPAALRRALGEIVRRHESLRTVFAEVDGAPVQVIAPFGGLVLPVEDLSGGTPAEREAAVRRRAGQEARRPFDLSAGPLFRAALLRVDADDHVLLLSMHHVVSDGWSMGVLFRELSALYAAYREGGESPLAELAVQYADYAVWQRRQLEGEVLDRQRSYWTRQLAGAPELLDLPTDRPRPPARSYRGATVPVDLSPALLERLQALGRSEGATLYMTLLGAFQVLLSRYGAGEDVVVGSPIAGRTRGEVEALIGFFVNTLVLRTDLSGDPGFRQVLRRVRDVTLGAYENQEVPFEKLVAQLRPERSLSHSPLFQVMFTLQNAGGERGALAGLRVSDVHAELPTARFDLTLELAATPRGLRGGVTYATDLFEPDTIQRMVGHLERVLEQVADDADARLSQLTLLGEAERARVLHAWNRTEAPYPADATLHALFQAQAARTPDAVAVTHGTESVTYAELNARANRLARHLARLGVRPEARVGIGLARGVEMLAGMLAVLKAGGAYVPLDPAYPAERLAFTLRDARVGVLLTQEALRGRVPVPDGVRVVSVDGAAAAEIAAERAENLDARVSPRGLAYLIYTSGSTGVPKGVAIEHESAVVLLTWAAELHTAEELGGMLACTSICFDLSVYELFLPLSRGGRVILVDNALALPSAPAADQVRLLNTVPSAAAALLRAGGLPAGVTTVNLAGEPLRTELVDALYAHGVERVIDLYGPSEDTTYSTFSLRQAGARATIGRPIANTRAYVLDTRMQPVPAGVPGELYLAGRGLARGYLGRPSLTGERFVPDPFGAGPGGRMYRTGDRARWTAEGTLEYLGRLDHQVKVRGFRIEPGEIEAALRPAPGVADCAVVVREDAPGDPRLVAYVVGEAEAVALREGLRRTLPEHMVPSAFVRMDALPLTPNGKLDRGALPAPELAGEDEAYVAPRTPTEEVLAGIWAGVLGLERVGVEERFFDLGGHSLLATRVVSRVRERFGVELPLRALFEGRPTVATLAVRVEAARRAALPVPPPVVPVARTGALPLSFAQERLWFIDRLEPESAVYNIARAWRLGGALDGAALERALGEVLRRHEALRTTVAEVEGAPVQGVAPYRGFALPVEDLSHLGQADREAAVGRRAGQEARRPFDLAAGPLFRAALLRLDDADHVLLLSMHHIVSDGWSMGVLFRELSALYAAYREGRASPLAELAVQYADYAVWQRGWLTGETLQAQVDYWTKALAGAPPLLEVPTDRPRAPAQSPRGARHPVRLSPALSEGLRALSRREGTTLFMTLLTAWQALLGRYSGQDDVVVGTPVAGRTRGETEGLIGFFVNMLALRADLSGNPTWSALLARTWETALGAYAHQALPFERLVGELSVERSLTHAPLFQTTFTLDVAGGDDDRLALGDLAVRRLGPGEGIAKYDLDLAMDDGGGALEGALHYRAALFEGTTIARMAAHLEILLEAMVADPGRRVGDQPLLREAERARVLQAWNATVLPVPEGGVHERFAEQAARTPDAVALVHGARQLTYGELAARVDRLAPRLRALGVGPETRVGICLERGPEMIVAVLATLAAGGAYVPIDPVHPPERVAYLLKDAAVPVVLTQAALAGRFADFAGTVARMEEVDTEAGGTGAGPGARAWTASPRGLAYVIYTSGSSGRPKGVGVEHASLASYAQVAREFLGITPGDRVLQFASLSFDTSAEEIFSTLVGGATLVLRTDEMLGSAATFFARCAEWGITVLDLPTAYWHELAAAMDRGEARLPPCVRRVVIGGEKVLPEAVAQWRRGGGDAARLINSYGPTEATVAATLGPVGEGALTIGAPAGNVQVYVLEPSGAPAPVGVPGELYVGGAGVARGYLGRPGLTAGRFVPDPFGGRPGARLYRTGDRARWRADGTLEYLGRLDGQVKVRGFRIEPEEIEAVLRSHGAVDGCAVVVREDRPGDRRLVAYVVGGADPAQLREHLRRSLPEYMVPGAFVAVDRLPLTPNGKLDRRALPAPDLASAEEDYTAPRTPVEEVLAGIWAELLGLKRVGVHDGFFALGGHSLLAMRLVWRIREALEGDVDLVSLFETPTIAGLAPRLAPRARGHAPVAPAAPVPPDRLLDMLDDLSDEELDRLLAADLDENTTRS